MKQPKISTKRICVILTAVFIISLVPLLLLSFYNHPAIDDYYYGIKTYHAASDGNPETGVLSAAIDQVKETYENWQGTYSAVFLFSLHPAIFGENLYFLSTFILLAVLIGSTFLFSYTFLYKYLQVSKKAFLIITLSVLMLSIQLVPSPLQSYFWWNGSIYYTFFYSLSLVMFSMLLIYFRSQKKVAKVFALIAAILLAAVLGGANYVTALVSCIILFFIIALLAAKKNPRAFAVGAVFVVLLSGLVVSMIAPGNAVRAANYVHTTVKDAIIYSFGYSLRYIAEWTRLPLIVVIALLTPLIARAAENNKKFSFQYPLPFVFFSFCIFTAQFTPPVYGMGSIGGSGLLSSPNDGALRILNIIYYSYFWLIIANVYYISGYFSHKYGVSSEKALNHLKNRKIFILACVLLVCVSFTPVLDESRDATKRGGSCAFTNAVYSLRSGEAKQFDKENNERHEILTDDSIKDVEFYPFSVNPKLLFYGDLTQDREFMWSNKPMREYFDKNYVITRWTY